MIEEYIEEQINFLEQCVEEEGETISEQSKKTFLNFIEFLDKGKFKSKLFISLSPDNEFYMTCWLKDKHIFRFMADSTIRYIVMERKTK